MATTSTLTGTPADDVLNGTNDNDTLFGLAGRDTINGLGGNDHIEGGDEETASFNTGDTLDGGAGDDTLLGGAGGDSLVGGTGSDVLDGGAGDDWIREVTDAGETDTLTGGDGYDSIDVQANGGTVNVDGGAGDDYFYVYAKRSADAALAPQVTLTGGAGSDNFAVGTGYNNYDVMLPGAVRVTDFQTGAEGDLIDVNPLIDFSSTGNYGFPGGNPFDPDLGYLRWVQAGSDAVLEYDADGAARSAHSYQSLLILDNVSVEAITPDNFVMGLNPDGSDIPSEHLIGTDTTDFLNGNYSGDIIEGHGGRDYLWGGAGNDTIHGGDEEDTAQGTGDYIWAGSGDDVIHGGAGGDDISGGYGNDWIDAGAGDDRINTYNTEGNDELYGGDGDDTFQLWGGDSAGVQTIRAYGGNGADTFTMAVMLPESGVGDDRIVVSGGNGIDTYGFGYGFTGAVTVTDFKAGAGGDLIDASGLFENNNWGMVDQPVTGNPFSPALGFLRLVQSGANTILEYDADGTAGTKASYRPVMELLGVSATSLTADNFVGGHVPEAPASASMIGGKGADTIYGTGLADTILGNAGNDSLFGQGGDDTLEGGDGNDQLDGGSGNDTLRGGAGNDTYVLGAGDTIVEVASGGRDKVIAFNHTLGNHLEDLQLTQDATEGRGNALANEITGNDGGVDLWGHAGNDRLVGGAGDDILDGGLGNDIMAGGAGHDLYHVDSASDAVTELADGGHDTVITTLKSYTAGANVETVRFEGTGSFAGTGNALDNVLHAVDNAAVTLKGEAGNDILVGGSATDQLSGGSGDDTLVLEVAGGTDVADGGAGDDRVVLSLAFDQYKRTRPTDADTVLTALDGSHSVTLRGVESVEFSDGVKTLAEVQVNLGSSGADTITGTDGEDLLDGGLGKDTLTGGAGDDTYVVSEADDMVVELADQGFDLVNVAFTKAGTYVLPAHVDHATVTTAGLAIHLVGNDLQNDLTGNGAANTLTGGGGDDIIDGKGGNDTMIGGDGNDFYYVDSVKDVVTEAADGGTDAITTAMASYTLGANIEALLHNGGLAFTGTGNALDNYLFGGKGTNTLKGEAGNDRLIGAAGNDQLFGGAGNDELRSRGGKDVIDGGDGDDIAVLPLAFSAYVRTRPNATDVVLTAAGGASVTVRNVEVFRFADGDRPLEDVIFNIASTSADVINGTSGADVLDGGLGKDELIGGLGDDTYVVSEAGDKVVELDGEGNDTVQVSFAAAGTYTMAEGVEFAIVTGTLPVNVNGNGLDNILTGNSGKNTLAGGAGNDLLNGGGGPDKLAGGIGDDVYVVDMAGDAVTELAGEGNDRVLTTAGSWTLGAHIEELTYIGTGAFNGSGNALDNMIEGGVGADKLLGLAGDDFLWSDTGADFLDGGLGNDLLDAGTGKDVVDGGAGDDVLQVLGNFADYVRYRPDLVNTLLVNQDTGEHITFRNVETIAFDDGERTLAEVLDKVATGGNDVMTGTIGDDLLDGGLGNDTLTGGLGNDTYVVNVAADKIVELEGEGEDGVNVAFTAAGTYVLGAHVEHAAAAEGKLAIGLTGNALDNLLIGNAGANVLTGGAGSDTLTGGAGADMFVLNSKLGADTITDFVSGSDKLRISQAGLRIGDGDAKLEGALLRAAAGGFGAAAELVVFTSNVTELDAASAAAAIGSANAAFAVGAQRLFAIDNGTDSALFLFTAADANATVSAGELTQLAVLTGTASTAIGDYLFVS